MELLNLVGGATSTVTYSGPTMADAAKVVSQNNQIFGGVTIAERHIKKKNEHLTVAAKVKMGAKWFITQAIYNTDPTIEVRTFDVSRSTSSVARWFSLRTCPISFFSSVQCPLSKDNVQITFRRYGFELMRTNICSDKLDTTSIYVWCAVLGYTIIRLRSFKEKYATTAEAKCFA